MTILADFRVSGFIKIKKNFDKNENRYCVFRFAVLEYFYCELGQFTRNYTQTVKRAADNK